MASDQIPIVLLVASVMIVPSVQAGSAVASGHIEAGGPYTGFMSLTEFTTQFKERVLEQSPAVTTDGFFFEAPPAGTWVTTERTAPLGTDYDLDIRQWRIDDDSWHSVEYCVTDAADEICKIHPNATHGVVVAHRGVDLDVEVVEVPPPSEQTRPYAAAPGVQSSPSWTHLNIGGAVFFPVGLIPDAVEIDDRSGGAVPAVACQDLDGDARCGEDGEPRVAGCTTTLDLTASDVAFEASAATRVFVEEASSEGLPDDPSDPQIPPLCPNAALGGQVTLSYAIGSTS